MREAALRRVDGEARSIVRDAVAWNEAKTSEKPKLNLSVLASTPTLLAMGAVASTWLAENMVRVVPTPCPNAARPTKQSLTSLLVTVGPLVGTYTQMP